MQTDAIELDNSREAVLKISKNLDAKQFCKNYPDGNFQLDAYKVKALSSHPERVNTFETRFYLIKCIFTC